MRYKEVIDKDVRESRIVDNLNTWEISMTKYPNIKYNPSVAKMIKTVTDTDGAIRLIINKSTPTQNEKKAYIIAKHLINAGISPSNVCITNIEDCYLSVRGFGDNAAIKDKIFRSSNRLIIIENMREIRQTDVKDNVYSFWQEFWAYCRKNRNLNVLLCFDVPEKDWYPREVAKAPHKELHFRYL